MKGSKQTATLGLFRRNPSSASFLGSSSSSSLFTSSSFIYNPRPSILRTLSTQSCSRRIHGSNEYLTSTSTTIKNTMPVWHVRNIGDKKEVREGEEMLGDLLEGIPDDKELSPQEVAQIIQKAKEKFNASDDGEGGHIKVVTQTELQELQRQDKMNQQQPQPGVTFRNVEQKVEGDSKDWDVDMRTVDPESIGAEARKLWAEESEMVAKQTRPGQQALPKEASSYIGETNSQQQPHGKGIYRSFR